MAGSRERWILRAGHSVRELETELDRFWQELGEGGRLSHLAKRAGFDPRALAEKPRHALVRARRAAGGVATGDDVVWIWFATVVLPQFWSRVVLPWFETRWGRGALKKREGETARSHARPARRSEKPGPARTPLKALPPRKASKPRTGRTSPKPRTPRRPQKPGPRGRSR